MNNLVRVFIILMLAVGLTASAATVSAAQDDHESIASQSDIVTELVALLIHILNQILSGDGNENVDPADLPLGCKAVGTGFTCILFSEGGAPNGVSCTGTGFETASCTLPATGATFDCVVIPDPGGSPPTFKTFACTPATGANLDPGDLPSGCVLDAAGTGFICPIEGLPFPDGLDCINTGPGTATCTLQSNAATFHCFGSNENGDLECFPVT